MLCGALAGRWLQAPCGPARRAVGLAVGGIVAVLLGLGWSLWLPLNKALWTGSFALTTAGIAALVFAVCYYVVDVRGHQEWADPFVWLGVNPLAIYCLSELSRYALDIGWIGSDPPIGLKDALFWRYLVRFAGDAGGPRSSLFFALGCATVWTAVAGLLHRRGVRLRF
jgi:predicted acyltransferase